MIIENIVKDDSKLDLDHPNRVIKEIEVSNQVNINDLVELLRGQVSATDSTKLLRPWKLKIQGQDIKKIVLNYEDGVVILI